MAHYLPGNIRDRIHDLMKQQKITQATLARIAGIDESTLSRFLSGKTQALAPEQLIRIAREFGVSTDFLLGIVNVPDKTNYNISELGLSAQAARNLYTQRVDPRVVNYLLESYQFAEVTRLIAQYLSGELAAGIAAHNELFQDVSRLLRGSGLPDGANDVLARKIPKSQELDAIQKYFLAAVKGMEKDVQLEIAAKKLTNDEFDRIVSEVPKGQEAPTRQIAPEDLAESIVSSIRGQELVSEEHLEQLRASLVAVMEDMKQNDEREIAARQ